MVEIHSMKAGGAIARGNSVEIAVAVRRPVHSYEIIQLLQPFSRWVAVTEKLSCWGYCAYSTDESYRGV